MLGPRVRFWMQITRLLDTRLSLPLGTGIIDLFAFVSDQIVPVDLGKSLRKLVVWT